MGGIVGTLARSRGGGGTSSGVKKRKWNGGRLEAERNKEGDRGGGEGA